MNTLNLAWRQRGVVLLLALAFASPRQSLAAGTDTSCYEGLPEWKEMPRAERVLYIFVDQTTPLSGAMKKKIVDMLGDWGRPGDVVKLGKFSANFRGRYPQLVYTGRVEPEPNEAYLYHLRYFDKTGLRDCLKQQHMNFGKNLKNRLSEVMKEIDPTIPKTDIFYSLRELTTNAIRATEARRKIVLLITDGLENSAVTSFYNKGNVRKLAPRKVVATIRKQKMIANWKGAEVYMYGVGLMRDSKTYQVWSQLDNLRNFWERYLVEGNALVRGIGTPELLIDKIN